MERPDSSKYPTKEAYDKAHDRWAENQQYTTTTTTTTPAPSAVDVCDNCETSEPGCEGMFARDGAACKFHGAA